MGTNSFYRPRCSDNENEYLKRKGQFTRHYMADFFSNNPSLTCIPDYEDSDYEKDKTITTFFKEIKQAIQNKQESFKIGMVWLKTDLAKDVNYVIEGGMNIFYASLLLSHYAEVELGCEENAFSWENPFTSSIVNDTNAVCDLFYVVEAEDAISFKEYFLNSCYCVQFHV